jgi:hypothetical protein
VIDFSLKSHAGNIGVAAQVEVIQMRMQDIVNGRYPLIKEVRFIPMLPSPGAKTQLTIYDLK